MIMAWLLFGAGVLVGFLAGVLAVCALIWILNHWYLP